MIVYINSYCLSLAAPKSQLRKRRTESINYNSVVEQPLALPGSTKIIFYVISFTCMQENQQTNLHKLISAPPLASVKYTLALPHKDLYVSMTLTVLFSNYKGRYRETFPKKTFDFRGGFLFKNSFPFHMNEPLLL